MASRGEAGFAPRSAAVGGPPFRLVRCHFSDGLLLPWPGSSHLSRECGRTGHSEGRRVALRGKGLASVCDARLRELRSTRRLFVSPLTFFFFFFALSGILSAPKTDFLKVSVGPKAREKERASSCPEAGGARSGPVRTAGRLRRPAPRTAASPSLVGITSQEGLPLKKVASFAPENVA